MRSSTRRGISGASALPGTCETSPPTCVTPTPGNSDAIGLDIDIEEMSLDMDLSVPCGLILNELLSNALKYAFPDGRRGTVRIRMHRQGPAELLLTVADDGVGFPPGVDYRNPATLGLRIVNILVSQIRGTLTMPGSAGSTFAISFPAP